MLSLQPCERVEEVTLWSQLQPGWMTDQSTYTVPTVNLVDYQLHAPSHTLKSSKTVAPWSRKKTPSRISAPNIFIQRCFSTRTPSNKSKKSLYNWLWAIRPAFFFTAKWILNVVSPFYSNKQLFYFHLVPRNCPTNRSHKGISIFFSGVPLPTNGRPKSNLFVFEERWAEEKSQA